MNIEITPATINQRPILRQLMELYQYDFSEFDHADLSPMGVYDYPYLDHYWAEPERTPFLVRAESYFAGFVLVARYDYFTGLKDAWVMAEFFIMRKYRKQGIGEVVARYVFDQFPGAWQVGQISENLPASAFWRKVIDRYTHGHYQDCDLDNEFWHGPVQSFISPPTQKHDGEELTLTKHTISNRNS